MTPDECQHFDKRFDKQDELLMELRDRTTSQNERIRSLEKTRSGVVTSLVLAVVAVIGSATMWLGQFLHLSNKP